MTFSCSKNFHKAPHGIDLYYLYLLFVIDIAIISLMSKKKNFAYVISVFFAFLWLRHTILDGIFLDKTFFVIGFAICVYIFVRAIDLSPHILRGLIYSFWILNIFHALYVSEKNFTILGHSFDQQGVMFVVEQWWFMLCFAVFFHLIMKKVIAKESDMHVKPVSKGKINKEKKKTQPVDYYQQGRR